jgi:AraC-like DNA-binding protein/ligand-binding sensor protein
MAVGAKGCGTGGNHRNSDLLLSLLVQKSLLEFHRVTGLAAKLIPPTLPVRAVRFGSEDNAFCRVMAGDGLCCRTCHQTQLELLRRLEHKLKPQQACCPGGMVHLAVPIVLGGRHVGTILGGRIRVRGEGRHGFSAVMPGGGKRTGSARRRQLRAAYEQTPVFSPERIHAATQLLDVLARLFAEALAHQPSPVRAGNPPQLTKAQEFVQQHLHDHLTTREAAHALNLSEAYFCRRFHRLAGKTFHAYVAETRTEAAKAALRDTEQGISDIALAVGFQSISDFNRVFKAHAGMTPSQYRLTHWVK